MPTSYTNRTEPSATSYSARSLVFAESELLLENGGLLLQETGDTLVLEQSVSSETPFTARSSVSTTYTERTAI